MKWLRTCADADIADLADAGVVGDATSESMQAGKAIPDLPTGMIAHGVGRQQRLQDQDIGDRRRVEELRQPGMGGGKDLIVVGLISPKRIEPADGIEPTRPRANPVVVAKSRLIIKVIPPLPMKYDRLWWGLYACDPKPSSKKPFRY